MGRRTVFSRILTGRREVGGIAGESEISLFNCLFGLLTDEDPGGLIKD